ncbi:transporter substrate-binding domain-containing protein [Bradyrhizobium sp. C-145]|uniref:c-type cytochrome n=1 Tax=Bradyrhizobium sp. C-145 TaxID=574727 RepID=UPI00201B5D63|nr:transporter substrate-binding domain-containing protein [Bradyrhizobium sp. C-145]UQR63025.1 transporter substrate-binding domain-containing protein [Bradyrhizobium sp. C-145]
MSVNVTGNVKVSCCKFCVLLRASPLALITILAPVGASSSVDADDVKPLRLCADPTNLPYSSDDASEPGFYLEVGQAIGKALGRPVTYNWYKTYFGKRSVRVTLLGKQCDAMMGLPLSDDFMGPAVIFSRKISEQAYALVTAKELVVGSIEDLRGKRVAVQYQTTPQNLLALRDDIEKVTVMSPDEGMKALDVGTAEVAFVWGPTAGWLNKTQYQNRYKIRTIEGKGLSWDAAIGFAKTSVELRDQVDAVLLELDQTIGDLATKYGLPGDTSTRLLVSENSPSLLVPPTAATEVPSAPHSPSATSKDSKAHAGDSASIEEGREVFNSTCAHCHGTNAVQGERRIDLRRLQLRYGENARSTFWTTVHEGRPSKGMPAWKDVLTDEDFNNIYAYLTTVQASAGSAN